MTPLEKDGLDRAFLDIGERALEGGDFARGGDY